MANNPKIYATCKAGCLWETVHKDDFLRSASIAPVATDMYGDGVGTWVLRDYAHAYRIYSGNNGSAYNATLSFHYNANTGTGGNAQYNFAVPFDAYRGYIDLEILAANVNEAHTQLTLVFEINGNRTVETISGEGILIGDAHLTIRNASEVFLFNANATVKAADGIQGSILYGYGAVKATETSITASRSMIIVYDGMRQPVVGDYVRVYYEGALHEDGYFAYQINALTDTEFTAVSAYKLEGDGLPNITSADAGKFLRVSASGEWVAETVPSAEGGSF